MNGFELAFVKIPRFGWKSALGAHSITQLTFVELQEIIALLQVVERTWIDEGSEQGSTVENPNGQTQVLLLLAAHETWT